VRKDKKKTGRNTALALLLALLAWLFWKKKVEGEGEMAIATLTPSLDGYASRAFGTGAGKVWDDMHDGDGNLHNDTLDTANCHLVTELYVGKWRQITRPILLFNASSIPPGTPIKGINLKLRVLGHQDDLLITPEFNIFSSNPASDTDIVDLDYQTLGTLPLSTAKPEGDLVTDDYTIWTLNGDGIALVQAAINGDGIVKLGVRESKYDAPDIEPTPSYQNAWSGLVIYTVEKGTDYAPILEVTYITTPTVTTNAATSIGQNKATLNGTLDDDGGEACDARFQYGRTTDYKVNTEWQSGKISLDTFLQAISKLNPVKVYHCRAQAKNSVGTGNGSDVDFTTIGNAYAGNIITDQLIYQHAERMRV